MTARSLGLWWLAAIILLTGVIALEQFRPAGGGNARGEDGLVFGDVTDAWPEASVTSIELVRQTPGRGDAEPTSVTFAFARDAAGVWTQTEPLSHPIDSFSMRELVRQAESVRVTSEIAADAMEGPNAISAGGLGLEPPRGDLTFTFDDGSTRQLWLGRRGIGGSSYLMLPESQSIYVVAGGLHERAVEMDPREWRDRTIFPGAAVDRLQSVDIAIPANESGYTVTRDARSWRLTRPLETRADRAAIDSLMQAVATMQSAGYVIDNPPSLDAFALDPGVVRVTVTDADGTQRLLLIGSRMGAGSKDRFAMIEGRPSVFRLPAAAVDRFVVAGGAMTFVDPTASGVRPADVKRIRVLGGDVEFTLVRTLESWTMTIDGEESDDATEAAVSREVNRLLDLSTSVAAIDMQTGQLPPELTPIDVVMENFDGRPLSTVRWYFVEPAEPAAEGAWVAGAGDGVLRIFPSSIAPPLTPAAFRVVAP